MSRSLTMLLSAVSIGAALATGCTSAGLCKTGSEGCRQNGQGKCDSGLVKQGDLCVAPGSAGTSVTGGTGMTGGTDATGGTGGVSPDEACAAKDLPEACAKFCHEFCNNQERLCVASS